MAGVVDLYSPRIQEEGLRQRHAADLLVNSTGEAAKQLFQYSINKQEIDKAYAEIDAKSEQLKMQNYWEDKLHANEFAARRFNSAQTALRMNPNDEAAWQVFSDAAFESTGVRPKPEQRKDIIDHLIEYTTDPASGGPNTKALEITANATKLEGPTGELIKNWTILREQGVANDDPRMVAIRDQLAKNSAIELGSWAGTTLSDMPPDKAIALYEYWKTLGPPSGSSTNVQIKMPEGGERKTVVDAIVLRKKVEDIRNLYNKVKSKYANWLNKPTGPGAETIQTIVTAIPGWEKDPLITELQKSISDYQQDRVRALTGAQHSDQETERYVGDTFGRGGSIISNQMNQETFESTLDLNQKWGVDYLDALLKVQKGYGLRTPGDVQPGEQPTRPQPGEPPNPPSAASYNQSGATEKPGEKPGEPTREQKLQALEKRRQQLLGEKSGSPLRRRRQERATSGRATTPPPTKVEPQTMLFNRALEMLGPSYGVG